MSQASWGYRIYEIGGDCECSTNCEGGCPVGTPVDVCYDCYMDTYHTLVNVTYTWDLDSSCEMIYNDYWNHDDTDLTCEPCENKGIKVFIDGFIPSKKLLTTLRG